MMNLIGELAALCAAITYTISSVFYRKALTAASPFQANLIRFTTASAVLVVLLTLTGKMWILVALPISVSVIAALSGMIGLIVGDTFYMFALKSVGVARAVPIAFTYPLFNVLIAFLLKGERVTPLVALGALGIVAGTWLICNKRPDANALSETVPRRGYAMALAAAVVWSVSITLLNLAVTSPSVVGLDGILAVTCVRLLAAWIFSLALLPVFDREHGFLKMSWQTWLMMASGGLVGSLGVGSLLLSFSFLNTQEARAVPISSTTPFFSVIAGIIILRETVTPGIIVGSIIIALGTFLLFI